MNHIYDSSYHLQCFDDTPNRLPSIVSRFTLSLLYHRLRIIKTKRKYLAKSGLSTCEKMIPAGISQILSALRMIRGIVVYNSVVSWHLPDEFCEDYETTWLAVLCHDVFGSNNHKVIISWIIIILWVTTVWK